MKVGVAGLTHGHVWGILDSFRKVDGVELTAVADATPLLERAEGFATKYTDWREMLDKETFDALIVTSDNVESADIAVAALEKGIPCVVEKAMAANAADADRMLAAQKKSGALLVINWPFAWSPELHEIKRRIDAGDVGHVFHMRYRNGHWGPKEIGCDEHFVGWLYDEKKNGGGAIADFGCYGAVLSRWYFGMPDSVYCVRHNTTKAYDVSDDHAIIVLKYPKRDVVLEATWATRGFEEGANPVVHGAEGTLAAYGRTVGFHYPGKDADKQEAPALPIGGIGPFFVEAVKGNAKPTGVLDPEIAADACRILDAAIKSSATGQAVAP